MLQFDFLRSCRISKLLKRSCKLNQSWSILAQAKNGRCHKTRITVLNSDPGFVAGSVFTGEVNLDSNKLQTHMAWHS
jgi:hypothetical protein